LNIISIWGGRLLEDDEVESLLRDSRIARFCCLNEDGTIHATPVWFIYQDGEIVLITPKRSRKARNLRRNDRTTILVDVEGPPAKGVMVYGRARMEDDDPLPVAVSIAEKYMPKERIQNFAEEAVKVGVDLVVRVKPERMSTFHF
jgi:PPOX class probable F420-dependent enzyme